LITHTVFHAFGQTFYQKTEHFIKTIVREKIKHKQPATESLKYDEFKKMYIEYVSELRRRN